MQNRLYCKRQAQTAFVTSINVIKMYVDQSIYIPHDGTAIDNGFLYSKVISWEPLEHVRPCARTMICDIQSGHIIRTPDILVVDSCEYFTEFYPFPKVRHLIARDIVNKISEKTIEHFNIFCVQCAGIMILKKK